MLDSKQLKLTLGDRAKDIIMTGLNQQEKNKKIICPFHTDKHPSMSWFEDGLLWKCMSCQETMDIYKYYEEFENDTFIEALNKVALLVGEEVNTTENKTITKKTFKKATENYRELSEEIINVAAERGIKKQTLIDWEVESARFIGKEWFVFKYRDQKGKVVFNTFRQLEEKICQRERDTKEILWGIDKIDIKKPVMIVEGQFDAMIVYQCGYKNVVSIPSGITAKGWIENCWNWLQTVEKFVIWADNDKAGIEGSEELRKRLGTEKTFIDYSEEYKDPNDMFLKGGENEVKEFIDDLLALKTEGMNNMGRRKNSKDEKEGFHTGFSEIDRHYKKLRYGDLTIVFGRDNEGKSTFLSQMIANVLIKEKVFLYSGELTDDNIENWIMSQIIGRKKGHVDLRINEWGDKEFDIKKEARNAIRKWYQDKFYVYENKIELDGNERMFKVMEQAYKQHGIRIFFIDNLMSSNNSSDTDSNSSETDFVKKCRLFAQVYNVHVFLVAHPNKQGSADHTPLEKVFVAGSKNITNAAVNVIGVERVWKIGDESLNEIYKKVDKQDLPFTAVIRCLKDRVATGRRDYFYKFDSNTFRFYNETTKNDVDYGWEKYIPKKMNNHAGATVEYVDEGCPM